MENYVALSLETYPGDYLYRSGSLKWDVVSGMWGIFRVMKRGIGGRCWNICRRIMNCVGR